MNELERRKACRDYFEEGCLCILNGVVLKLGTEIEDLAAYTYYEKHCTCSRNYKHLEKQ